LAAAPQNPPAGSPQAAPPDGGPVPDAGLLSPERSGTPVEAAVTDRAWLQAMLDAESGLARAQAGLGLVPQEAARTITRVARAENFDLVDLAHRSRAAANPVVAFVQDLTAAVAAVDPSAADYVHRGSTSQDVLDTAVSLVASRALRLIVADLERTAAALAGLAGKYRDTAMPGRTLTQHAVPTTFGLKAAGWLQLVCDAADRARRVLETGLPVELGGAAGTLAGYLEYVRITPDAVPDAAASWSDRLIAAYARELGRPEPVVPWHTVRTPIADLAAALSFVTGALGKIAADVQLLSRTEVGEVVEPAAPGRGASSAMPHKRNPVLATMITSAALQMQGPASVLAQCMLAVDERPAGAWHAEWQPLREALRLAGGAAHTAVELAEGLIPFPERMRENLSMTGTLMASERVAVVLAPDLGKAEAKRLVTRATQESTRTGRPLAEVIAALPETAGRYPVSDLETILDPTAYVGGAPDLVDRALHHYEVWRNPAT
jgi:3-carboxy-cis,cis-muconate cycloisomerase